MPPNCAVKTILSIWVALTVCFILTQVAVFNYLQSHLSDGKSRLSGKFQAHVGTSQYERSCSDLFGVKAMTKTHEGKCLEHSLLRWKSCSIGSIFIDTTKIHGSLGGEPIESVMKRKVEDENLNFTRGSLTLQLPLSEDVSRQIVDPTIASFLQSSIMTDSFSMGGISARTTSDNTTLLIRRGAYANPCMAIISMYNAFIVQKFLLNMPAAQIIWLDGHARSENMDAAWEHLFQTKPIHVKRLIDSQRKMEDAVLVNTMSAMGDEGLGVYGWERDATSDPVLCKNSTLGMFRDFVLERYGIERRTREDRGTSCRLTLLVRKHHLAHPRSTGRTDRVLANVTDDIAYIQSEYPECRIAPVSFEDITFRKQLEIVSQSDIIFSVHGAGNIHVLFLPSHGKLVEFFPKGFTRRLRFQYLAECLGVSYEARKAKIVERFPGNKIAVRLRPKK